MAYDNGTIMAAPRTARTAGSVTAAVEVQAQRASELEKAFEDLADRLRPILSNHPRAANMDGADAKPSLPCDLAGALTTNADRIGTVVARIQEIISRIEL